MVDGGLSSSPAISWSMRSFWLTLLCLKLQLISKIFKRYYCWFFPFGILFTLVAFYVLFSFPRYFLVAAAVAGIFDIRF
jgi:hypothetical protein